MRSTLDHAPLSFLLAQAHRQSHETLHAVLMTAGVSVEQWRVLSVLGDGERMSVSAMAAATGMRVPATSKTLERLERRGLLRRERDGADQRRRLVQLSDQGALVVHKLAPAVARREADLVRRLGHWEAERLQKLLLAMLRT